MLHALILLLIDFSKKKRFSQLKEMARLHFKSVTSAVKFS